MNQIATWISGIGSFAAGIVAAIVLIQQGIDKRRTELRDQASKVTWWLESVPQDDDHVGVRNFADGAEFFIGQYGDLKKSALFIRNDSGSCVYEGSLQLSSQIAQPGSRYSKFLWRQLGVLPPGTSQYRVPVPVNPTPTSAARSSGDVAFNKHVEWIEFRDRNNRIWRRFRDGRLELQPNRSPVTEAMHAP